MTALSLSSNDLEWAIPTLIGGVVVLVISTVIVWRWWFKSSGSEYDIIEGVGKEGVIPAKKTKVRRQ